MSNSETNRFKPDYVSHPGETLFETLVSIGMSQTELSDRTGLSKKTINKIIKGKAAITPDTAVILERVLGVPASFWNNFERIYRENIARIEEERRLEEHVEWSSKFPLNEMIKLSWIRQFKDKVQQLLELLRFFAVTSPEQWVKVWLAEDIAFRKSKAFQGNPEATSAWLRRGEIEAQNIDCGRFDPMKFKGVLWEIRNLTTEPPEVFQPEVERLCAESGVAVAFIPELPGAPISGATRWLGEKALIQLSLRYKSDDQLWFSFFHEAGHILDQKKRDVFLKVGDEEQITREKETSANRFASDLLIPPKEYKKIAGWKRYGKDSILLFAENIGISPGIVVGRLQHDGYLPFTHCNDLKLNLRWEN